MIKRYRVVGWYSPNPLNTNIHPTAIVTWVDVEEGYDPYGVGEAALAILADQNNLINWYIEEDPV